MEKVYLLRCRDGQVQNGRLAELIEKTGWPSRVPKNSLVALKLHFGEQGNKGQIAPRHVAEFVKVMKRRPAKPFLCETSTLYVGRRSNAYDHMMLAFEHGYTYGAVGAPIIMADGLRGQSKVKVKIPGRHNQNVEVAADVRVYDAMLVLTHVTGHMEAGLGGTIKNLGMGLSSRAGKLAQHSAAKPSVIEKKCAQCGNCTEWCPSQAITLHNGSAAVIDSGVCIGCGECLAVCPFAAIKYNWDAEITVFHERMAEYALGTVIGRQEKVAYVSFLTNVTKNCDCIGKDNETYFDDIGVIASNDPVALDQAAMDLVNQTSGKDFFRDCFPEVDPTAQLVHAERIGLGSRKYQLEEID